MTAPPRKPDQLQLLWRITGMAFMMSSEVAAGAGIGWLIDRWQDTFPRWMTIGGVAGIVVGMTTFLTAAFRLSRQMGPAGPVEPQSLDHADHADDDADEHARPDR